MTVAIALVRHGHYEQPDGVPSAWLPHPLTAKGEAQARAGAVELVDAAVARGWTIHPVVDTSPLLRAWQTARIWVDELARRGVTGARLDTADALCERSLGAAANLTVAEIERVIERDPRFDALPPGWKRARDSRLPLPGAESLAEAGARVAAHVTARWRELAGASSASASSTSSSLEAGTALKIFVGHGGSIRNAAIDLGILAPGDVDRLSMHYGQPVVYAQRDGAWHREFGDWKLRSPARGASLDPHARHDPDNSFD